MFIRVFPGLARPVPIPRAAPPSAPNAKPSKASNAIFICSSCPQKALWCVTAEAARFSEAVKIVERPLAAVDGTKRMATCAAPVTAGCEGDLIHISNSQTRHLRANGSRECAPDERLREAIHSYFLPRHELLRCARNDGGYTFTFSRRDAPESCWNLPALSKSEQLC
jgi:hypothetical protein